MQRITDAIKTGWIGTCLLVVGTAIVVAVLIKVNWNFTVKAPGGNDFLVSWVAMRAVLQGRDPYSDETALDIENRVYGRPAASPKEEIRFPYPIYSLFLFFPCALIANYALARAIWMTGLELAVLTFASVSMLLFIPKWNLKQRVLFLLFSILWYFGIRVVVNGNVVVWIGLFLSIALLCLSRKWDYAAGIALALTTVKPQVAIFPLVCTLIWLMTSRRWKSVASFLATMVLLAGVGFAVRPGWVVENIREVLRYSANSAPGTPAAALGVMFGSSGTIVGWALSLGVCILIGISWISLFRSGDQKYFEILTLTIILAPLAGLPTDPGNQIILLLPIAFLLGAFRRDEKIPWAVFTGIVTGIFLGLWLLFLSTLTKGAQPVQHPIMLFPLPVFLFLVAGADWLRKRLHPAAGAG